MSLGIMSGLTPVHPVLMITVVVVHTPYQRYLVHQPCMQRKRFTDVNAWHIGGDWLERTSYPGRGIRLRIKRFKMTGCTIQPVLDDRRVTRHLTDYLAHHT